MERNDPQIKRHMNKRIKTLNTEYREVPIILQPAPETPKWDNEMIHEHVNNKIQHYSNKMQNSVYLTSTNIQQNKH